MIKRNLCFIKIILWKFAGLVAVMKFGDDGNNNNLKILKRCPFNVFVFL